MTGPSEPVDEEVVEVLDSAARDSGTAFPTEQMVKHKKKDLKETGRKPVKQKPKQVEQHFDDCGEGVSSLVGISTSRSAALPLLHLAKDPTQYQ